MLGKTSVSDLSEHVFDLILELYNIDSHLLLSVLPQLEFKLKVSGSSFFLLIMFPPLLLFVSFPWWWLVFISVYQSVKSKSINCLYEYLCVKFTLLDCQPRVSGLRKCTFYFLCGLFICIGEMKQGASQHNVSSAVSHEHFLLMDNAH